MTRTYDPATALVVVDVQNDFAHPAGSLAVAGGPEVVAATNAEVAAAAGPDAGHFGVQGMHERARKIAGELTLTSTPGKGTFILITVPLNPLESA